MEESLVGWRLEYLEYLCYHRIHLLPFRSSFDVPTHHFLGCEREKIKHMKFSMSLYDPFCDFVHMCVGFYCSVYTSKSMFCVSVGA